MDDLAIQRRLEHTIEQCRAFDIDPDARTVAEIMVDEDTGGAVYEERALAFDEYEKAAARALRRLRVESQIGLKGRQSLAFSGLRSFTKLLPPVFQNVSLSL